MRYCEYVPDPRLADVVRCYWVFEADATPGADDERVAPDGSPELIFHYGDAFSAVVRGAATTLALEQPRHLFAGQLTQPLFLRASGRSGLISVRFTPWGARRLFRMPMTDSTDAYVAVDALGERWLVRLGDDIDGCDGCDGHGGDRSRIALIERALDAGYFDQPHMIRDFRRFAGIAPRAFVQSLPVFSRAVASVAVSDSYKTGGSSAG